MLDREMLAALPFSLRIEIAENLMRKDFTQSELAEIQQQIIEHLSAARKANQGKRTDLETSTQTAVEVGRPKRVENTTEQVARLFGESEHTTRKRLAVVAAARAEPEKFGRLVEDMDRTRLINGPFKRLTVMRQADAIRAEPPPLPAGPFRVIVADPPWPYDIRQEDPSHRATHPYPQMSITEICALPVAELATDDASLWLWTTNHHLLSGVAFEVADAWGFARVNMLTWGKNRIGTGDTLRGQTEHALFCKRGSPVETLTNESTLLLADARANSEKPAEFFRRVESLCAAPPGGYLELFARKPRPGWVTWGDEVPRQAAE